MTYHLTGLNECINALGISLKVGHYIRYFFHLSHVALVLGLHKLFNEVPLDLVIFRFYFLFGYLEFGWWQLLRNRMKFLYDICSFI